MNSGMTSDKAIAMAMDPMYRGLRGKKVGQMKTLTEIRLDMLKQKEKKMRGTRSKSLVEK